MQRGWRYQVWRSAVAMLGGGLALVAIAYGCFVLRLDLGAAGFILLMLVAAVSLAGRFIDSAVLSCVAVACLDFLFSPPIFSFQIDDPENGIALAAFLFTSLVITGLATKVRRLAEQELRETRAALARFARVATLGELTASIAHEVNQPLAGVVTSGNACMRWLAADPPNIEKANQSLQRIIRDANRASEVVGRVRRLIKNSPPQKAALNINEAIQEIILLSRHELELNRIAVATELADDVPPVLADRIQLQQVVMNLIGNAIEALCAVNGQPRELAIRTEKDERGVLATVRDSGIGLDPAKAKDIFNPFYTTKSDGMGMGLAISRSIIEAHGGHLWAEPHRPRGTVFRFTLPPVQEAAP